MKFLLVAPLLLVFSCSQMKRHVASGSSQEAKDTMDSVDVDWSALEKIEEDADDGHALVEAKASDDKIAESVGEDMDTDEAADEVEAPSKKNSRPFLKKVRTKRVKFWVDYFTQKQRDRFQRFLNNGAMYRPIIEKILEEQGVPRELFFVGLIESGYYLGAHSTAAAVGPWQFIRGTGLRYGMAINKDYDERRDIFKATVAAAQYFKDLHNIFSSWELALAAYNAGEYGIIRRITKHKTRDYYSLSRNNQIPKETINYVPKVLAAMHVVENAEHYGFTMPKGRARFWQKTKLITAPKGASLVQIARRIGVSSVVLAKLNPELRQARTPRSVRGPYSLRVPAGKQTEWMETLVADNPMTNPRDKEIEVLKDKVMNPGIYVASEPFVSPRRSAVHQVKRGETLSSIARKNRISLKQLAMNNKMTVRSRVRVGQKLRLGYTPVTAVTSTRNAAPVRVVGLSAKKPVINSKPLIYKLNRGETLTDVSKLFGVSVTALKSSNKISRGKNVHVGAKIKIPNTRHGIYTVRNGDGLIKISQKFDLPQKAIMRLNNMKRAHIYPGQRLVVNLE